VSLRHFQGLERHRLRKHPAGPAGTAPIYPLFGVLTPSATDGTWSIFSHQFPTTSSQKVDVLACDCGHILVW